MTATTRKRKALITEACAGCGSALTEEDGVTETRRAAGYCDTLCAEDAATRQELYRRGIKRGE